MQDYMIQQKDRGRAEEGVDDRAIQDFRKKMDERKYEAGRHKNTVGLLSGLCSVLGITVLAGGVAMFNNYRKMHEMESVIASAMPAGSLRDGIQAAGERIWGAEGEESQGYVIDEAEGQGVSDGGALRQGGGKQRDAGNHGAGEPVGGSADSLRGKRVPGPCPGFGGGRGRIPGRGFFSGCQSAPGRGFGPGRGSGPDRGRGPDCGRTPARISGPTTRYMW